MLITPNPINILDYCNAYLAGQIKIDGNYQRTDKVWPEQAKKYLIESIVLGYPIPKLFLHQKIDVKSKQSIKYVVDGQQRSKAILEFFQGKFAISKSCQVPSIAGKTVDSLPEEFQNSFMSYPLPVDLFITASREEIIETFRRINSYTVPLNSEEKRHAYHQGHMKWFIHAIASKYSEKLAEIGTFTDKNLARMVDFRFYSELVCFISKEQLVTTGSKMLDDLYSNYDEDAEAVSVFYGLLDTAISNSLKWPWLIGLNVTKSHIFQMIIYAFIVRGENPRMLEESSIRENLSALSEAIEMQDEGKYKPFIEAASRTTNDRKRREVIFDYVSRAIFG